MHAQRQKGTKYFQFFIGMSCHRFAERNSERTADARPSANPSHAGSSAVRGKGLFCAVNDMESVYPRKREKRTD